ncbi:MAG: sugar ABC transporter ATP-binding protein [Candidatus Omnitrophica bacterium]|nr:sugar ABC transporter ATP-binding protein [Candidatus Omnitrophota bacterium]
MSNSIETSSTAPLLSLRNVTKRFGGVAAIDGVDFELRAGEIHALLGENGAGKSTLIKILAGIYHPDAGSIHIEGRPVSIAGVSDANQSGIRVIHQELSLAPNLTIAENIYLGREPGSRLRLDRRAMENKARTLIHELGLDELRDVRKPVHELSAAHRQLVEIARALSQHARILILDEPTSSLSEAETEALFDSLHRLRNQGVGVIYISHRLEEIARIADRITVLRDGKSMGTQLASQIDHKQLVKWMVGRDIIDHFHRPSSAPGNIAMEVRHLKSPTIRDVSFTLRYGEIVGMAGLVGAGRTELARALFGIDSIDSGDILIDGRPISIRSPGDALEAGVVLAPEDRRKEGLVMIQSVAFNLAIPWTRYWNSGFFPDYRERRNIVQRAIDGFGVKLADPEQEISSLSGGNQQKVLVGRWMEKNPKILILDEPTRGVDVGSREEMFRMISRLVEEGMAILLISSDLDEVMNVSHRIAIYRDQTILQIAPADQISPEEVMERLTM